MFRNIPLHIKGKYQGVLLHVLNNTVAKMLSHDLQEIFINYNMRVYKRNLG